MAASIQMVKRKYEAVRSNAGAADANAIGRSRSGPHTLLRVLLRGFAGMMICAVATGAPVPPGDQNAAPKVPLTVGLTVVTAIAQKEGDYESIKRVESITPDSIRIRYSADQPKGLFDLPTDPVKHVSRVRLVATQDQAASTRYLQWFSEDAPDRVPGTTALGTSSAVLRKLKATGQSAMTVYLGLLPGFKLEHLPRYALEGKITRVEPQPVLLPVLVNDRPALLPTVHAKGVLGKFSKADAEFFFLDDESNPIVLRFQIGNDKLRVVKIIVPEGGGQGSSFAIERALTTTGRASVYGIYFDFAQASIKQESEGTLSEIADVLAKNPQWKLNVEGHTDNVGGDAYNQDLSRRRAAAVKDALVSRFHISGDRLVTSGFGASTPKDTNDTLEGRARNRRVELVRGP